MIRHFLFALLITCVAVGCSRRPETDAHQAEVNASPDVTFDAVQRAAQAVDEGVSAGLPRERVGELVGSLAKEVQNVKRAEHDESHRQVIAAYEDVLAAYQLGLDLWDAQVHRQTAGDGSNEIPVKVGTMVLNGFAGAQRYKLPISTTIAPNGVEVQVVPSDSVQQMWTKARALSKDAAALHPAGR